jgi:ABC-type amino acid transport substrate-binding protein
MKNKASFFVLLFIGQLVYAETIRAGIFIGLPFVTDNPAELPWSYIEEVDGRGIPYYGMAVDLWTAVEKRLKLHTEYYEYDSLHELIQDLEDKKIDIIITNLTITYDRAQRVKFTFPWYTGGLRTAINTKIQKSPQTAWRGYIIAGLLFVGVLVFLSLVLMLFRKKYEPPFPRTVVDGFTTSFRDLAVAIHSGILPIDSPSYAKKWLLNIISALWMLLGVGFIAYITSTMTRNMTTASLAQNRIETLQDLGEARIGVTKGSSAEEVLKNSGFTLVTWNTPREIWNALIKHEVDAFVYDAPILEYYNRMFPHKNIKLLNDMFHPEHYAFAVNDIQLSDRISTTLIGLEEEGIMKNLEDIYLMR